MPISDRPLSRLVVTLLAACGPALVAVNAAAADAAVRAHPTLAAEPYGSVKEALRAGVRDYNAGDKIAAAQALEYAATQGHALALWKLGRMYADGDGVPRNDAKAYECFSRIADDNADEAPDSPRAGMVANAFTSLGGYFLDGIKGTSITPNAERAAEMYSYAASYFGDPAAQFSLARLYLGGTGVPQDPRQAARWLNLAAEKGHSAAQALLGQLLIDGQGIPRQRARGLMWLALAKQAADPKREAWISALHDEAFGAASESDRRTAMSFLEQFQAKRR